ncbi:MAG TPA: Hpt domain-containing protein [Dokdonella sp.]|uniref:Hpt domain-containing protein n=1 Tax=Dokdonella sp. TaxID=2291710 RepID=UPI002BAFFA37|nr:Hpt domain-containing protein [Dokdonella sp.]
MTEIDPRFVALQARYRASLAGKRADIEQAWQALAADCGDTASQAALLAVVHRLAGSAESYGFDGIGRLAAQLDRQLEPVRCKADPAQRSAALCALRDELARPIEELLAELRSGAA